MEIHRAKEMQNGAAWFSRTVVLFLGHKTAKPFKMQREPDKHWHNQRGARHAAEDEYSDFLSAEPLCQQKCGQ